jgi:hypothetical protein
VLTLCLVFTALVVSAQQLPASTLADILHHLQDNLDQYQKFVPSFYCSEHVVSDANYGGERQYRATDSSFRVARGPAGRLIESREIKSINGTPVRGQHLDGPVTLGGVFTGGLVPVSESERACMHYTLQSNASAQADKFLVIHFNKLPEAENKQGCVLKEDGAGLVLVDPATMQVTKMELQAPHHTLNTGEHGLWKIVIDYAPTALAGKTFWMPTVLNSTLVTDDKKSPTIYSYFAHYYDYHKLEVTSRIVPGQQDQ